MTPNDKPPYRVPSMAEVAAAPWNGFNAVSTFSGCGGSCLGYRMAGFRVLWASEFIPAARETYRANHPGSILDPRDIRQVKPEDILRATGLGAGELDLFDGSPPCASFSTAGKREAGWGKVKEYSDTRQRTDDLFFEFARLVRGVRPKVFVAENVSGLVKGKAKGYFLDILAALKACGYRVRAKVLDAQWLGVPQVRQRVIFVGVREDLGLGPAFPAPLPYRYSVRDALPWIGKVQHAGTPQTRAPRWKSADVPAPAIVACGAETSPAAWRSGGALVEEAAAGDGAEVRVVHTPGGLGGTRRGRPGDLLDAPAPTVCAGTHGSGPHQLHVERVPIRVVHETGGRREYCRGDVTDRPCAPVVASAASIKHYQVEEAVIEGSDLGDYAIGKEWDKLRPGEQSERYLNLVKPDEAGPCPTVTAAGGNASTASVTHPVERRKFTIAELKRICAFPDDFILTGTYAQQWERLGRAVPPLMMRAIAEAVRDRILLPLRDGA